MFVGGKSTPYRQAEYEEARAQRRAGVPIKQIAGYLAVSPSTVHRWTTDIELSAAQRRAIDEKEAERWRLVVARRAETWGHRCRAARLDQQLEGRARAREGSALHQAGCMLYWAQGSKNKNAVTFSNSDRAMIVCFRRFLAEEFCLTDDRFSMSLNVYLGNGMTIEQIEASWLESLELPASCVRKHLLNHMPTSSSGRRKNKLAYGVCTLRVTRSTPVVQHIYGAIQEYAGFDEPAWLG